MITQNEQRPIVGIFWMLVTGFCFVGVTALVKTLDPAIPAPVSAFMRYVLGLVFLIPMIKPLFTAGLSRQQWSFSVMRGVAHSLGVALWFFAMTRIPIADVTAMNYLVPIYVTVGAALFLGEKLALRRALAVAAGLLGALIIVRPGFRDVGAGHIAMLGTALMFGVSYLMAKRLSRDVSPAVVVALLSIFVTIGLAPLALANWVTPSNWDLLILFAIAFLATAGHYTMTMAFAAAPVTVTQPVTFLQLIWAVMLGYFLFDEGIDPFVVAGGGVIIAAVSFITWREAVLKRRVEAPPTN